MALTESSSEAGSHLDGIAPAGSDAGINVVWVWGEHDISTSGALWQSVTRALAVDDGEVVVDLSEVQFMGVAAVGVIVRAREFLRLRSRTLTLRSPSTAARRTFDLCGLSDLLAPHVADSERLTGTIGALGTWVAVPATDTADRPVAGSSPEASTTKVPAT